MINHNITLSSRFPHHPWYRYLPWPSSSVPSPPSSIHSAVSQSPLFFCSPPPISAATPPSADLSSSCVPTWTRRLFSCPQLESSSISTDQSCSWWFPYTSSKTPPWSECFRSSCSAIWRGSRPVNYRSSHSSWYVRNVGKLRLLSRSSRSCSYFTCELD